MPLNDTINAQSVGSIQAIFAVTPNDGADLPTPCRSVLITVAGDLRCTTDLGQTVTIPVQIGWNPIRVRRIFATGTTATGIFVGY